MAIETEPVWRALARGSSLESAAATCSSRLGIDAVARRGCDPWSCSHHATKRRKDAGKGDPRLKVTSFACRWVRLGFAGCPTLCIHEEGTCL